MAATGTEMSCLIEAPRWRCTSPNISRMRQKALRLLEAVGDGRVAHQPLLVTLALRMSSSTPRRPARACEDNSISTYQGCCPVSGIAACGVVLDHRLDARTRHQLERGDAAGGALFGERQQVDRRLRRGHAGKRRFDRARPRHQTQRRRGDDAERAFRADEQVLQVVAGIVLLQLVEVVQHAPVGQHHFQAERVRARDAMRECGGAAGVGREIAADGAGAFRRQQLRIEPVGVGCRLARALQA